MKAAAMKASKVLVYLLAFSGCLYQLCEILDMYFTYPMITELTVSMPDKLPVPDLSLCVRYVDIFEFERYERENRIKLRIGSEQNSDLPVLKRTFQKVTIKDIFDYTPQEEKLINWCLIHDPASYKAFFISKEECRPKFNISKYYVREFVCFRLHMVEHEDKEFDFKNIACSLLAQGLYYFVKLNGLEKAKRIQMIVSENIVDIYPETSSAYAPVVEITQGAGDGNPAASKNGNLVEAS